MNALMKKSIFWSGLLIIIAGLMSCQTQAGVATVTPSTDEAVSEASEVESAPTDTAVPQPTNTPQPTATAVPPTSTPLPSPTPPLPDAPELVWLPYASGNYGEPVLVVEDGELTLQDLPVGVEIYFDYKAGWLAYGRHFWQATANQDSVTELRIYNFVTDTDRFWADKVGRAALSPVNPLTGEPDVAVAVHNGQDFDLIVMPDPDNSVLLVENIDPFFSWSPDGNQIAYVRSGELFITPAAGGDADNPAIATGLYQGSSWIGDAPLWLGDSGYILFADAPFTIVATDGSETLVPLAEDSTTLEGSRPFAMLYSSTHNQLIAESEWMFGSSVVIYQFSKGFETAVLINQFDDAQLAGWYEEGESLIIVSGGEPFILSLTPQE